MTKGKCLKDDEKISKMLKVLYAQAMGILVYALTNTRPDIYHVIRLVSKYQSNIDKEHWQVVNRIQMYLWGTKNMKFVI